MFKNKKYNEKYICQVQNITNETKKILVEKNIKVIQRNPKRFLEIIQVSKEDKIEMSILKLISRRKYNVYYNGKVIFSFLSGDKDWFKEDYMRFALHNEVLVVQYTNNLFFMKDLNNETNCKVEKHNKILAFLYSVKDKIIIAICSNLIMKNRKLNIDKELLINSGIKYKFSSYYEYNNEYFVLLCRSKILLFKLDNLINIVDISFSLSPFYFAVNSNEKKGVSFQTKENNIYDILLTNDKKKNDSPSKFDDITLSNDKLKKDFLSELEEIILTDSRKSAENYIQENNLVSIIEESLSIITPEKISFFINYTIPNKKFKLILLVSILTNNYTVIDKIKESIGRSLSETDILLLRIYIADYLNSVFPKSSKELAAKVLP